MLEERRAKARHDGRPEEDSPMRKMMMTMMKMRIPRGSWPALTGSCKAHRKPTFPRRAWGLPRGRKVETVRVTKRRCHLAVRALTRLLLLLGVGSSGRRDLPRRLA